MGKRTRYTADDIAKDQYYKMPKFLFEGECQNLSNDARVLYSLLRDRHSLSLANGWINENNEVYFIYSRKDMENILGISDKTVKKAVDALKELGLIEEERMGLNRANIMYLTAVSLENRGIGKSPIPVNKRNRKISDSRIGNTTTQESENLRPNKTYNNKTDISNESVSQKKKTDGQTKKYDHYYLEQQIDFNYVQQFIDDFDLIDSIKLIILEVLNSKDKGEENQIIKSNFLKLKEKHIVHGYQRYKDQKNPIINPKAYLKKCLNSAIQEYDLHYINVASQNGY